MKILLDTNILFSAIIKPDGEIARIVLNIAKQDIQFYGCYFSYIELFKYKEKMIKASKLEEIDFLEIMYAILKRITFFNEEAIPKEKIKQAYHLTFDIDEKDTVFLAMSLYLNCKLWSGDVALKKGLANKKFYDIINTFELKKIIEKNKI